ncbi:MAG: acyl carrier protein [Lachnospiraceae bacterium]|nr:acyl carrier protein [Lachnospiraceae bacterium]
MEELKEILNGIHPEVDYETETGLIDRRIFDSFDVITLVGELMDTFDIEITAEQMIPENFNSMQDIWNLVERLMDE